MWRRVGPEKGWAGGGLGGDEVRRFGWERDELGRIDGKEMI